MRALIASIRTLLVLLALAAPLPAMAAEYTDSAALDELFAQLKASTSPADADEISQQIWGYWLNPMVPDLVDRMHRATGAMNAGDLATALSELNDVVRAYPDYAEGWNQRATIFYMLDNFDASLSDIDKVLTLEPRHFGALSGRVLIYLKQGKRADALRTMAAALAIHPYLSERQLFPELQRNVTHV